MTTDFLYHYQGTITNVVDGDTLDILFDLGFKVGISERVRLAGINCPEAGTEDGDKATAFVKQFEGASILVQTIKDHKDKYGRYLANVWVDTADGQNVLLNDLLLENGLAVKYP